MRDKLIAETSFGKWWKCAENETHIWLQDDNCLACPYCSGGKKIKDNALSIHSPHLIDEWDFEGNCETSPSGVARAGSKRIKWKCIYNHKWDTKVSDRSRKDGTSCPYCSGKRASPENNLANYKSLCYQFDEVKNGGLLPINITPGSNKKVWWTCDVSYDHVWEATVASRVIGGNGCPFCAGNKVSVTNSLSNYPDIARELHPHKNQGLTSSSIIAKTGKKLWWLCSNGHEWQQTGNLRVGRGAGCPYCSGKYTTFQTNLNNHTEIANQFHPTKNGNVLPGDLHQGSHKKVWWLCEKGEDHVWQALVKDRVYNGTGCPFCAGQRVSVTNSMKSNAKLNSELHPIKNIGLDSARILHTTTKKLWWLCSEGHEWLATGDNRTRGKGCPYCAKTGFDPSKSSIFYVLKIKNEFHKNEGPIFKIGITNRTVKERYGKDFLKFDICMIIYFEDGLISLNIESFLKSKYKKLLYRGVSPITGNDKTVSKEIFIKNIVDIEMDENPSLFDNGIIDYIS